MSHLSFLALSAVGGFVWLSSGQFVKAGLCSDTSSCVPETTTTPTDYAPPFVNKAIDFSSLGNIFRQHGESLIDTLLGGLGDDDDEDYVDVFSSYAISDINDVSNGGDDGDDGINKDFEVQSFFVFIAALDAWLNLVVY